MLASKSPTTTVLPLTAIEMPNQSLVARVEGVSSASCTRFMGGVAAWRSVALRIEANKIIVESKRRRGMGWSPWESGVRARQDRAGLYALPSRAQRLFGVMCGLSQAVFALDLVFGQSTDTR